MAVFQNDKLEVYPFDARLGEITKTFDSFNDEAIGVIGASKALHVLNSSLFVPWDNKILEGYHKLHPNFGRSEKDEECYSEFLRQCKAVSVSLLSKTTENDLSRQHPAFVNFGQFRTIAKMIDECNYCFFTAQQDWKV